MTDSDIAALLKEAQKHSDLIYDAESVIQNADHRLISELAAALRQVQTEKEAERAERESLIAEFTAYKKERSEERDAWIAREAVLLGALQACTEWISTVTQAFSVGKLEEEHPLLRAQTLLANPSPAAQALVERLKAAEGMAVWIEEHTSDSCCPVSGQEAVDAYRRAGPTAP